MEDKKMYIEILLPIPLDSSFTYAVPTLLFEEVQVGKRVIVSFGRRGILTGIIIYILKKEPKKTQHIKEIIDLVDEAPIIAPYQIKFLKWMSEYYLTPIGIVFKNMLPSGFRFSSESKFQLNPEFCLENKNIIEEENIVLQHLKSKTILSYTQINKYLEENLDESSKLKLKKKQAKTIQSLVNKGTIIPFDSIKDKYTPKIERRFKLTDDYLDKNTLNSLLLTLNEKQQDIILLYLQKHNMSKIAITNDNGLPFLMIKERGLSLSSYNTLKKNSILEEFNTVIPRFSTVNKEKLSTPKLTNFQQEATNKIKNAFQTENKPVLLYGKTGTGKTIIYMHLIDEMLEKGKQVLFLTPEIALTSHLTKRLKRYYGNLMAVYHSRFSDNERVEIWKNVLCNKTNFVLGVRSSVFLPFQNLGLIIIDESHDASYKQWQQPPFYRTNTLCEVLQKLTSCQLLFGSGTPDIETMYRTQNNRVELIMLESRYGQGEKPEFTWVDLKKSTALKTLNNAFDFSTLERIKATIENGHQVIVFQNRRGYAPSIRCESCQSSPKCPRCDVSLTYHLSEDELMCHYCGYHDVTDNVCQYCSGSRIKTVGYGTEKIAEDLKLYIQNSKVIRLDSDVTKSKYSHDKIITAFSNQEANILVGTQMIIKGLDFSNATLVVVVNADYMLTTPNYTSYENTFQTLSQVCGRVGRGEIKGEVIIQTFQPKHPVYNWIEQENFNSLYDSEIQEREKFSYPPFYKLILLEVKSKKEENANHFSLVLFNEISKGMGKEFVFGPTKPRVAKINLWHIRQIYIKLNTKYGRAKTSFLKSKIKESVDNTLRITKSKNIRVNINVDP